MKYNANRWGSVVVSLILFFLVFYTLVIMGHFLYAGLLENWVSSISAESEESLNQTLVSYVFVWLAGFGATGTLLMIERRRWLDLGLGLKSRGKDMIYGALTAIIFYLVGFGGAYAFGWIEITGVEWQWYDLWVTFLMFVLVALTEEVMFRGYLLSRLLNAGVQRFVALFVTSILFALMHLSNPSISWLPMVNLVIAGLMLGVVCLYTHNLWYSISLHLFWNWIQGPVLGYEVSGNSLSHSLVQLQLPDHSVWNGGAFGFEGSLTCTLLMVLFIGGAIWWGEKRRGVQPFLSH